MEFAGEEKTTQDIIIIIVIIFLMAYKSSEDQPSVDIIRCRPLSSTLWTVAYCVFTLARHLRSFSMS